MNILIVSATQFEIQPILTMYPNIPHVITGVGVPATIYTLLKTPQLASYDLIIQAGIAGAYTPDIELGSVFQITKDKFGDIGAENADGGFYDIFELGFISKYEFPFTDGWLVNPTIDHSILPLATGNTLNKVTGKDRVYNPPADLESMEVAGFFYVCLREKLNFLAIRAVSNYVEKRDKSKWKINEAIQNLNEGLLNIYPRLK
jgi:futalosine hydrolase